MCYALKSTYRIADENAYASVNLLKRNTAPVRLVCDTEYAVAPAGVANRNRLKPQHNRFYHGEDNRRWDTTVWQKKLCTNVPLADFSLLSVWKPPPVRTQFSIHLRHFLVETMPCALFKSVAVFNLFSFRTICQLQHDPHPRSNGQGTAPSALICSWGRALLRTLPLPSHEP